MQDNKIGDITLVEAPTSENGFIQVSVNTFDSPVYIVPKG
jgi:hypothetical protein